MADRAKVDINEIGLLYVRDKSRRYQMDERKFDPSTIQDFELRDGEMRRFYGFNLQYNRDRVMLKNNYPGMWG